MTPRTISGYGWRRDLPDFRDRVYSATRPEAPITLPSHIDLRAYMPPVYDQGQLGSCTANAIAGAFQYELGKQKLKDFTPSRLFIYYNERSIEGTVGEDSGAQIRDGIKSVNKLGVCPESELPYDINKFTHKPTAKDYKDALNNTVTSYLSVSQDLVSLKTCLAEGYPVILGFTVYSSLESSEVAASGVVPMPAKHEKVLGGHAVLLVGYDDVSQTWILRNSWGDSWGQKGYFTMPYAYLTSSKLASDFWTIRLVA